MCGIAGLLNFSGRIPVEDVSRLVREMTGLAVHRGPDDEGYWNDPTGRVALGHRRLSIIDLSVNARQPMLDHSGRYVGLVNGEIYNYQSLRRILDQEGIHLKSQSDSEVLINLFSLLGEKALQLVDGMFAVAIYDTREKSLFLARDAAGEKPLYFVKSNEFFAFSSELTQLLPLCPNHMSLDLCEEALTLYFTLRYVPAPRSILKDVAKLEPGTHIKVRKDGEIITTRWFEFSIDSDANLDHAPSIDSAADEVEDLLSQSISDRFIADVPVGVFLSSGIDSSLIAAIAAKKLGKSVKTFSCGIDGDPNSEHQIARDTADYIGAAHFERMLNPSHFERIIENIGATLDEPNGDRSCVPTRLLSNFAKEKVTVALSGDGGDELFAGYSRYLAFSKNTADPQQIDARKIIETYFTKSLPVFPLTSVKGFFNSSSRTLDEFVSGLEPIFTHPGRSFVDSLRLLDFHTYLPGAVLSKVDRMSMQDSLEVRSPFLFRPLIDWASRQSPYYMVHGNVLKRVLRILLGRYLTDTVTNAPKKGFGMPASVFAANKERVQRELHKSYHVLRGTTFFSDRPESLDRITAAAGSNINSIWSYIILAKWIEAHEI